MQVIEDKTIYAGKWLHYKILQSSIKGRTVNWEYVTRPPGHRGGVEVVPIIDNKEIVVIANFRAPIQKFCLEFPAGLVDVDGTVEENGLRELIEETGFHGTLSQSPIQNIRYDAWKSNENGSIIVVNIDSSKPENQNPVQHLESDENIIVYKLKLANNLTQKTMMFRAWFGCSLQVSHLKVIYDILNMQIIEDKTIYAGKWLHYKILTSQINGRTNNWEYISRPPGNRGGVELIPIIDNKEIVLIANYRAPIQNFCLEFPAGIVDPEGTVEENGIRELKEETGFHGTLSQYPIQKIRSDAWKSNEYGQMMVVSIDSSQPENQNPVQHLEGDENIIVYRLKLQNLTQQIQQLVQQKNYDVSCSVWLFALGLSFRSDL